MRVLIVTPAPPRSLQGNRVTANRWARLLRGLGHRVSIARTFDDQPCDVLVALHAVASGASIRRFRRMRPHAPVVLVLTGTDLYRDLPRRRTRRRVLHSMAGAEAIVTLNEEAVRDVPRRFRRKVRCILQSAASPGKPARLPIAAGNPFVVLAVGHLRWEKDSLRPAYAVRHLPRASRIVAIHLGRALRDTWRRRAEAEMARNPRYRWLGELGTAQVRRWMARSALLAHPSRMEGGANAIGEAIQAGLPVLASRVPGNVGLVGRTYPGLFRAGDTAVLRRLLLRAERDAAFLQALNRAGRRLAPRFDPRREVRAWRRLMAGLRIGRLPRP